MELQGTTEAVGTAGRVCVPSCWHHISRRLRRNGYMWLLLLQGA